MSTKRHYLRNALIGIFIFIILFIFSNHIIVFANKFRGVNKVEYYPSKSIFIRDKNIDTYVMDNSDITIYIDRSSVLYQRHGIDINPVEIPNFVGRMYVDPEEVYVQNPYVLVVSNDDSILIHNVNTGKQKVVKVKVCPGARVKGVSYGDGVLYWRQYKEWSTCTGIFRKKLTLDF